MLKLSNQQLLLGDTSANADGWRLSKWEPDGFAVVSFKCS